MKKKTRWKSDFIEHEADVTDGESGDEEEDLDADQYVMDSFIDDQTQMTQSTPAKNQKGWFALICFDLLSFASLCSALL